MQMVPAAGGEPVRIGHLGEEIVVGVADAVEEQAEQRHRGQRPEAEVVQHHGQHDHVAQHQRLDRMEAVGRERRGHHRAVMRQVKAPQRPGVQQAVVDPEVHVIPGQQEQDLQRDLLPAGVRIQMRPAQLQQPQGRPCRCRTAAPTRRTAPARGAAAPAPADADPAGARCRARAGCDASAARWQRRTAGRYRRKQQPRQHDLPDGQGLKSLGHGVLFHPENGRIISNPSASGEACITK